MRRTLSSYVGERFGYLTVVSVRRSEVNGRTRGMFKVKCDCGTEKEILSHNATQGKTKSCGCRTSEFKGWNVKHGLHGTRLYQTYVDMKQRCLNPNNSRFHRYGGRGIKICQEWLDDFLAFYTWAIANGYQSNLTIDRRDNDGDYTPDNCRWVTMTVQLQNRDFSRMGGRRKHDRKVDIS